MKTIEAIVVILAIGLATTVLVDVSLYSSNQQLSASLTALNQSYSNLNQSYYRLNANLTNMSNQLNRLRSLLSLSGLNDTLGLNFSMTLNSTVLNSGQSISITFDEWNFLDSFNNVTASGNWSYSDFQGSPCYSGPALPNLPFSIAIVQGYYTESNLTGTISLPILSPPGAWYSCPLMGGPPTEFDFYPTSDRVIVCAPEFSGPPSFINESATQTLSFNGYYAPYNFNGTTQTINFPPGVYTVVGGDEWGQLVVLHFIVFN